MRYHIFWHYPSNRGPGGPGIGVFSALRLGDWKLIHYHLNEGYELFNIIDNIGEKRNLAEN